MDTKKFFQINWLIWILLVLIAPLRIILMWVNDKYSSKKVRMILSGVLSLLFIGFLNSCQLNEKPIEIVQNTTGVVNKSNIQEINKDNIKEKELKQQESKINDTKIEKNKSNVVVNVTETKKIIEKQEVKSVETNNNDVIQGYRRIEVDGGNISGKREKLVVVDVGYGDREYWAYTNEYGQLFKVTAKKITLQDDSKEPVLESGRYYPDEAKVPGTERKDLDEGHIIADSMGGVSNSYNITPQNSVLNRHGDQAYMEEGIRSSGGCTNFEAIISYPNNMTQIPSRYKYTYTLRGNIITDEFDNINPDEYNKRLNETVVTTKVVSSNNKVVESNIAQTDTKENVVYITNTGKKYHTSVCRYLTKSKIPINKTDALNTGYTACGTCKP